MKKLDREDLEIKSLQTQGQKSWAALGLFLAELPELVAWYTQRRLIGINCKETNGEWTIVLTATRKGQKQVSFFTGDTMLLAYRQVYRMLYGGKIRWTDSKY